MPELVRALCSFGSAADASSKDLRAFSKSCWFMYAVPRLFRRAACARVEELATCGAAEMPVAAGMIAAQRIAAQRTRGRGMLMLKDKVNHRGHRGTQRFRRRRSLDRRPSPFSALPFQR